MALFGLIARPRASLIVTILLLTIFSLIIRHHFAPHIFATPIAAWTSAHPRVELVVAAVKADDTSWIQEHLPYPAHVYVADDPTAPLTVQKNIGHESNIYLTYDIPLSIRAMLTFPGT